MALSIQSTPDSIDIPPSQLHLSSTFIINCNLLIKRLASICQDFRVYLSISCAKCGHLLRSFCTYVSHLYCFLLSTVDQVWIQLSYFISVSLVGFLLLRILRPKTETGSPKDLDLFFMSVSATTLSSMATMEMEDFSSSQLAVLAILMLLGGEVFISMLELYLLKARLQRRNSNKIDSVKIIVDLTSFSASPASIDNRMELGLIALTDSGYVKTDAPVFQVHSPATASEEMKCSSIRMLSFIILGYLLLAHISGIISIFAYVSLAPSAIRLMRRKGYGPLGFSIFMTISSFANVGFTPMNENMLAFRNNPLLLFLIIPLLLTGNTLFPPCLRLTIWILRRFFKREELDYLLNGAQEIGFHHLLPKLHSECLLLTSLGFIALQVILFSAMEWNSKALDGLNSFKKIVAALFQSVNSRHAGESVVNLSILSPAILASYVVMMYLPPYTRFLPFKDEARTSGTHDKKKTAGLLRSLLVSQLSYLAIFVILICITERRKIEEDPLNFSVFNIVVEVISAYGNVGFSTGYSCERRLKPDGNCKDAWYGFVGAWSTKGKLVLIVVMLFGRLKKFSVDSGKAWKLS